MKAVVGLLVFILGVSHGLETHCDGRQDGAHCFGPLGGTVVLQLMDRALETERYKLYKSSNKTTIILTVINNTIVHNGIKSRSSFNPSNGTFRVNNLSRTDSDEYPFEISDGINIKENRALRLTIQAPVSSVRLASECLSQGEKRVSCSSGGGDSPQYSWTLDERSLTDTELQSVNTETNSITLRQHVSGALACSVRNNVSKVSQGEEISNCGFIFINCTSNGTQISQWVFAANNTLCVEPTTSSPTTIPDSSTAGKESTVSINPCTNITSWNQTVTPLSEDEPWYIKKWPIMAGVLSALVLLLVVGVAVVCAQRKKRSNQPNDEDEQELTYAVVKIKQRSGRQVQQRAEPEVEYGQVKFSERPRLTADPAGEECVYAKVRRGR